MNRKGELFGTVYEKGRVVFSEGDRGDYMYIVQSGAVEIVGENNGRRELLAVMETGDFFGEMALIDGSPRSATAVTLSKCRLLPVDKTSLGNRVSRDHALVTRLMEVFAFRLARTNTLLVNKCLDNDVSESPAGDIGSAGPEPPDDPARRMASDLGELFPAGDRIKVGAGETLFAEGDTSRAMYLIKEGRISISRRENGRTLLLDVLGPGVFFGEMALITDRPRTADARAVTDSRLIEITREEFDRVMSTRPEVLLYLLQLMVHRLRQANEVMGGSGGRRPGALRKISSFPLREGRLKVALISLSSCAGCTVRLLEEKDQFEAFMERAEVVYSPLLIDADKLTDCDVAIVDGLVRVKEEVEHLEEIRSRCRYLVAWGTCATVGGIPLTANLHNIEELVEATYGSTQDVLDHYIAGTSGVSPDHGMPILRRAGGLDDHVRVDYFLPGCPPEISLLNGLLKEIVGGGAGKHRPGIVCRECPRKQSREKPDTLRVCHLGGSDPEVCFTSEGILCVGFQTAGLCQAACPAAGLPCWGCRGPSLGVMKKIDAGQSQEQLLIGSLMKRCGISREEATSAVNVSRHRGNCPLNFEKITVTDRTRIR